MFKTLSLAAALALGLTGCTSSFLTEGGGGGSGTIQSVHAYGGAVDVPGLELLAQPNAIPNDMVALSATVGPDGTIEDTRSVYIQKADGTTIVTGRSVEWFARAYFCRANPDGIGCRVAPTQ